MPRSGVGYFCVNLIVSYCWISIFHTIDLLLLIGRYSVYTRHNSNGMRYSFHPWASR